MRKEMKWGLAAAALAASLIAAGCGDEPKKEAPAKAEAKTEAKAEGAVAQTVEKAKIDLTKVADGTYKAESEPDKDGKLGGDYSRLTVTVEGGKITAAEFVGVQKDGTVKGEDYGKTHGSAENPVFYKKAQLAVKANKKYAEELVAKQDPAKVDAVSGATIAYRQFQDAAGKALSGK